MKIFSFTALVFAAAISATSPARAGTVNFSLNEIGVAGLEQMLDIARKAAPTMREADMAVSLYNALQQSKLQALQTEQQAAQAAEQRLKALEAENAKLKEAAPK